MKKLLAIVLLTATIGSTAFGFFGRGRCGSCCEDTCGTSTMMMSDCCTETVACDSCGDTCC